MPSSIFSSERTLPGRGFPWALLAAIVLVVLVEGILHVVPKRQLLGYGKGLAAYSEVRHQIEDFGASDIAVVGSSRGRESLLMPELSRLAAEITGEKVTASNYSCPDGKADELALVVQKLTSGPRRPRLVLCMVSPRILHGNDVNPQRLEVLGWRDTTADTRMSSLFTHPTNQLFWQFREFLEAHYLTFRHRDRFRRLATGVIRNRRYESPVLGGLTEWQIHTPRRSLVSHPVSEARVRGYVDRLIDDQGAYVFGESRIAGLKEVAGICSRAEVPFAFVEVPVSGLLQSHYPADLYPRFRRTMHEIAATGGHTFFELEDMSVAFEPQDFREQSHLNLAGAAKLTQAVFTRVVAPLLNGEEVFGR